MDFMEVDEVASGLGELLTDIIIELLGHIYIFHASGN